MSNTKRNIIFQIMYQIIILIIPFITAPYISRVLGAEQVGIYSYTYSIVNYFMLFSLLGLDLYGNRTIAKVRNNSEIVNKVFTQIFLCHLIPSILSISIYMVLWFSWNDVYKIIGLVQLFYLIGELLNINWFFAGMEQFKVIVIRNMFIKILTIIMIFLLVRSKEDLLLYVGISSIGSFLSQSLVWVVLKKYVHFVRVDLKSVLMHLKPMSILFISVVANSIYRMLDKTMLGSFGELEVLGCYEYADRILSMPIGIIIAIGAVMLSKTSNLLSNDGEKMAISLLENTLKYVTLLSSLFTFGFILYGVDFAVLFFGDEYLLTGKLLAILALSFTLMSWNSVIRTQFYIPKDRDKEYVISLISGAIINVCLNIILIPLYSAFGAAVSTVLSYLVVMILQLFFARKELKIKKLFNLCIPSFVIGMITFLIMVAVKSFFMINWISFIVQIFLFSLIFIFLTIILWKFTGDSILYTLKVNYKK